MGKDDLVLLHGALGSGAQFDRFMPLLEESFKVWRLDFEGHGYRPMNERPFSTEAFMENVLELMHAQGLSRADLFGYSMGGHIAMCLARHHPERVGRVMTFATKFHWSPQIAAQEAAMLDAARIRQKVPQFAQSLQQRHTAGGWEQVLAKTQAMMIRQGEQPPLSDADYSGISQPVRLSLGDRDKMVSIEETVSVYRLLPDAQLQLFPATAHPIEQAPPEMLAGAITSFFRR